MRLTFVHLSVFVADWRRLKLDDDDLRALELLLLEQPETGKLIPGSGGLRKVRFAPPSWNRGKRGGARVCYAYFSVAAAVYLVAAYGKKEKEDISADDKKSYRRILAEIESALTLKRDER